MDASKETAAELDCFRHWVPSRKAAAATIDMQTCELWWAHTQILDPYGLFQAEGTFTEEEHQIGRVFFARSPESDGRVCEYDLSPALREAMWARVNRGDPDEFDLLSYFFTAAEATEG
jgi:hypothetical protein